MADDSEIGTAGAADPDSGTLEVTATGQAPIESATPTGPIFPVVAGASVVDLHQALRDSRHTVVEWNALRDIDRCSYVIAAVARREARERCEAQTGSPED